jgi:hypothetical protein
MRGKIEALKNRQATVCGMEREKLAREIGTLERELAHRER